MPNCSVECVIAQSLLFIPADDVCQEDLAFSPGKAL